MAESALPENLQNLVRLLAGDFIHVLVDKRAFMELPGRLQGVTTDVTGDMIEVLRITTGKTQDIYVFTSLNRALDASAKMLDRAEAARSRFMSVAVTPLHFLKKLKREVESTLTVDFSYPEEMVLHYGDYKNLEKLFLVARLSKLDRFYVVHNSQRLPVSVETDEGQFAVAFVNEADSKETLVSLAEEDPGAGLIKMKPRVLAERVLDVWELDGVILNLGTPTQSVLERPDVRTLFAVMQVASPNLLTIDGIKQWLKKIVQPAARDPRFYTKKGEQPAEKARPE